MIGRKDEINRLQDCMDSENSEFVVVYGRRRVGKTYLIKEFFNNEFSFFATGVPGTKTKDQLKAFNKSLLDYGYTDKSVPSNWFEAFHRLEAILKSENVIKDPQTNKKVVFLDEVPWMATAKSDFKVALDLFWNGWASAQKDIVLIVCGSATSWIIDNIVHDTGGFYLRVTSRIYLKPFSLKETEEYLISKRINYSRHQLVEAYMIFGGIPYYLNMFNWRLSLAQNVDELCFKENGQLKHEFYELFTSLFKSSENHINVIRYMFDKECGVTKKDMIDNEVISRGGNFTKVLNELEQCGFIRKYSNFSKKENEPFYQIIDPLVSFYLSFMENGNISSWVSFKNTGQYNNWCGHAFERVCLLHTDQIKSFMKISGIESSEYSWRSKKKKDGGQIDLLIDRKDDIIDICEMKYCAEKYKMTEKYYNAMVHRKELFREETKTEKSLHLVMIASYGVTNSARWNDIVYFITENDLFN